MIYIWSMSLIEKAVAVLNSALEADSQAVNLLFAISTECNDKLADHPTIQVVSQEKYVTSPYKYAVRNLGLINGILEEITGERICSVSDDKSNKIIRFEVYKNK
jgi:hypothetical protein